MNAGLRSGLPRFLAGRDPGSIAAISQNDGTKLYFSALPLAHKKQRQDRRYSVLGIYSDFTD